MIDINNYLSFRDGFYIEAGANDGISQSNTLHLEQNLGWKGVLVEPNPYSFAKCLASRSKQNIFIQAALVSNSYNKDTIEGNFLDLGEHLSCMITEPLDYFDRDQMNAVIEKKQDSKKLVKVKCVTLQSIIDQYQIKKIDYLSLDVEGYEFEIFSGLDFIKNPPTFMRIETSTCKIREEKTRNYVKQYGYDFIGKASENDDFYGYRS